MDFFQTNLGIFLTVLGQTLLVLGFVMISLLLLVYGDRKIWGAVQMRRGPNVVGPWGILQTHSRCIEICCERSCRSCWCR